MQFELTEAERALASKGRHEMCEHGNAKRCEHFNCICPTCTGKKSLRKAACKDIKHFYHVRIQSLERPWEAFYFHTSYTQKRYRRKANWKYTYQNVRSCRNSTPKLPQRLWIFMPGLFWTRMYDDAFDLHVCVYAAKSKIELVPYLMHPLAHIRAYAAYRAGLHS